MPLPECDCIAWLPINQKLDAIYCATYTLAQGGGGGGTGNVTAAAPLTLNQLVIGQGGTAIATTTTGAGILTFLGTPSSANLAATVADETGSGALVFATSPTLVTPALGTPSSGNLTNTTGFPVANLAGLGTGVATFLSTPSSANLAAAVTGETGTGDLVFATSPTLVTPNIGAATASTFNASGAVTISAAGAANTAAELLSGTVFTGGTGTTNFPHLFIQPTGATAATTWSTAGTIIGVNAVTGFTGNLTDLRVAGTSVFSVSGGGSVALSGNLSVLAGSITIGATRLYSFSTRGSVSSPSDGVFLLQNSASSDFGRLQFGGTTSAFPAIKRSSTSIQIRLADDSADASLTAATLTLSGNLIIPKTVTPAGTTGAQTIDKISGSVNFAAGATSLVVTNALVTVNSIIHLTIATNDLSAQGLRYTPGAGSFTIRFLTAPAGETRVDFLVTN